MKPIARLAAGCAMALLAGSAAFAQTELRITHAMSSGAGKDAFDQIVAGFEAANPGVAVDRKSVV